MIIQTVSVADVQSALGAMLIAWPDLIDMTTLVLQQSEKPPDDYTSCPWLGVYCVGHKQVARTLGAGAGMRYQRMTFWIVAKEASPNSGNECSAKLEALVQKVTSCLLTDCSIGGTVDIIEDIEITYPEWGKQTGVYLQTAVIQFTAQTTVRLGG